MKNLVLLIQSDADVKNLASAAEYVTHGIKTVWGLISPAVVVSAESATQEIDAKIKALDAAKEQAKARDDFDAAKQYAKQREELMLDKSKAVADAWRNLPADENMKRTKAMFTPFGEAMAKAGISLKLNKVDEHYEPDNSVNMLNSRLESVACEPSARHLRGDVGERALVNRTASEISETVLKPDNIDRTVLGAIKADPVLGPIRSPAKSDPNKPHTAEELEAMPFFTLRSAAVKLGVWVEKQPKPETIKKILAAQAARTAA